MRADPTYSTWWNGGLRTTAYFHNQIGLLTEAIGSPTPVRHPVCRRAPGAARGPAVSDRAAALALPAVDRLRAHRQSRGARRRVSATARRCSSTSTGWEELDRARQPRYVDADAASQEPGAAIARDARGTFCRRGSAGLSHRDEVRERAAAQRHHGACARTCRLPLAARRYPAGSFVVKTSQAFRPHVLDMFEPQDHPDDIPYPGAPPTPPYDSAGWTLAFQMGVKFDRILDGFDGPFETLAYPAWPPVADASWRRQRVGLRRQPSAERRV